MVNDRFRSLNPIMAETLATEIFHSKSFGQTVNYLNDKKIKYVTNTATYKKQKVQVTVLSIGTKIQPI